MSFDAILPNVSYSIVCPNLFGPLFLCIFKLESFFGIGSGRINVKGILSSKDTSRALIQFKNKTLYVVEGDTVAGGKINSISQTNLVFTKDGEKFVYDLSINNENGH